MNYEHAGITQEVRQSGMEKRVSNRAEGHIKREL
jgi:hypothetical protein